MNIGNARLSPYILLNLLLVSTMLLLFHFRRFSFFRITDQKDGDNRNMIKLSWDRFLRAFLHGLFSCFWFKSNIQTLLHCFIHTYHMHEKFMWITCVQCTHMIVVWTIKSIIKRNKKQFEPHKVYGEKSLNEHRNNNNNHNKTTMTTAAAATIITITAS